MHYRYALSAPDAVSASDNTVFKFGSADRSVGRFRLLGMAVAALLAITLLSWAFVDAHHANHVATRRTLSTDFSAHTAHPQQESAKYVLQRVVSQRGSIDVAPFPSETSARVLPQPTKTAPASTTSLPQSSQQPQKSQPSATESLLAFTNAERERRGLQPLRIDSQLTIAAQEWARYIANEGRLVHRSQTPYEARLGEGNFVGLGTFGENLYKAVGNPHAGVPINGWMRSASHRENLLEPKFDRVGFGIVATNDFTWVVAEYGGGLGTRLAHQTPEEQPIVTNRLDGPLLVQKQETQ